MQLAEPQESLLGLPGQELPQQVGVSVQGQAGWGLEKEEGSMEGERT